MWKINAISDTHTLHGVLTHLNNDRDADSDILIHAGDISSRGNPKEVEKFMSWYNGLDNYKHKLFIHSRCWIKPRII